MSIPSIYKHDNDIWYVKWTDGRRSKRKSLGTKSQVEAKARFAQWLMLDGAEQAAEGPSYTVADLWTVYDRKHVETLAAPGTARNAWKAMASHFGALMPAQVPDAVPDYIEKRSRQIKLSSVRRELVVLRAMLNWCADGKAHKRLIEPVGPFGLPPAGDPRDRWFTQAEIDRLLAASESKPRYRLFMQLALETAGREGALLDLTWDRVDFETKVIHLHDPAKRKTKKRRASVPISAALMPVLREAYAARKNNLVLGHKARVYLPLKRIARDARVHDASPNVFRHTAATRMARNGVPLWIIAKVLGNSLVLVERVYAKHCPDDLRAAVDIISGGK